MKQANKIKTTDPKAYGLFLDFLKETDREKTVSDSRSQLAKIWHAWISSKNIQIAETSGYFLLKKAQQENGLQFKKEKKIREKSIFSGRTVSVKQKRKDIKMLWNGNVIGIDTRFRLKEDRNSINQKKINAGQLMKTYQIDEKRGKIQLRDVFTEELKIWVKSEELEAVDF